MAIETGRRARPQKPGATARGTTAKNPYAGGGHVAGTEPFAYRCPNCAKENRARVGREGTWLCGCWRCGLDAVAAAAGCARWQLLEDAPRWLAPFVVGSGAPRRKPDDPPSEAKIAGWHARLLADSAALDLLRAERGLSLPTVREFEIGLDSVREGFTLPVRNAAGELVNVSWRAPKGQTLCLPSGRRRKTHRLAIGVEDGGLPLYPYPLPPNGGLLCEGELDCLLARQHGLPAFTGLLGKQWHSAWDGYARGRAIACAYDVGAEEDAARTVEQLHEAGAREAWVVPLGLPNEGDDLSDFFVKYRRSAGDLRDLIRRARRRAR